METTLTKQSSPQKLARERFKHEFYANGVQPVDSRQPISDELALAMIQELEDYDVSKDVLIGVFDAFLILSTHLKEAGYTNLVLLESSHQNLTSSQEKYYNNVKTLCGKSNIKYYIPPMNNYGRCDMKFDVIIGNPPYQSGNGSGDKPGSATNPLWWQITKQSVSLLKKNGILSFITPTNILSGGDIFTSYVFGEDRKIDLRKVDFTAGDSFKGIGTQICRWVAHNSVTEGNVVTVSDGRELLTNDVIKLSANVMLDSILMTLFYSNVDKFNFNSKDQYHVNNVERYLKKNGMPVEWAKDLKETQDDVYKYPINMNGKIKYTQVKWKCKGDWKVFYPQLQVPAQITIANDVEASPATLTMICDSEQDAITVQRNLSSPEYRWIVDSTRQGGRVTWILSHFPNAPIEEVLTAEQLSYIQSQLS